MKKARTPQEMFGADAICLATMLHLVSLTKGLQDGPFKSGFEMAIEEAGAYLDSEAGDGGDQAQTLMEQMLGLVNGCYALTEIKGPMGAVVENPREWIRYADKLERVLELVCGSSKDELMKMHAAQGLSLVRPGTPPSRS